jgi:hypothetical protein
VKFDNHPDVRTYEDSVILAVEARTDRSVTGISMKGRTLTVTLDQTPTTGELDTLDDILAATERYRTDASGSAATYELQKVDPDDPNLPDTHMTFDQRISELVGDAGKLGKNKGGVDPPNVTPDTAGRAVDVQLPDSASETAKQRVESAMLAFGKTQS